jgi:hypothetical protein
VRKKRLGVFRLCDCRDNQSAPATLAGWTVTFLHKLPSGKEVEATNEISHDMIDGRAVWWDLNDDLGLAAIMRKHCPGASEVETPWAK